MRPIVGRHCAAIAMVASAAGVVSGCFPQGPRGDRPVATPDTSPGVGLVLRESEGERRTRRPRTGAQPAALTSPVIIKVDGTNGGSSQLFMGYEDIPPGEGIVRHYHPHADEIVFVHRGHGIATLGDRQAEVAAGTTIYIPHNTRISLRNTGTEPVTIAFIFADPTMSSWFRDGTVPEGQPAPIFTAADMAARRARHREHIVHEP
jgi:putative monooxygenase